LAIRPYVLTKAREGLREPVRAAEKVEPMPTLEEITDRMKTAVGADSGLGKSVKFDLRSEGVIRIEGGAVTNEDLPADCTISVSKDDFLRLAQGKLDPTMAFMQGKLKVNGDMGVAMKLQPLLSKARSLISGE
jgi:putative sterol carrier protein